MRRLVLVVLALALAIPLAPAQTAPAGVVSDVTLGPHDAHGLLAVPPGPCKGIVVIAHGYNHDAESHRGHLQHLADLGFVAIAMDYRGPKAGFPLHAGAVDTIDATRHALTLCPDQPAYLYSVSMGTAVVANVLPELAGVFDVWVNNEGLSMLTETFAEATLVSPGIAYGATVSAAIRQECGGTPAESPGCYVAFSAALRADEFGLKGAVLTHGLNDGLVPYNQGREMVAALRANGIPADFHTVVRGNPGGEGTTITGYGGANVDGLAGHGTESNDAHALTALSFRLLDEVILGTYGLPENREIVVDRDAGALP